MGSIKILGIVVVVVVHVHDDGEVIRCKIE